MWKTVEEFRDWYIKSKFPLRPPFTNPVFHTDNAMSLCLYREGRFQVELYITKPFSTSPPHTHPGVESAFMYLTGNLDFFLEGRDNVSNAEFQKAKVDGTHMAFGSVVSSPDGIPHWLKIGKEGAAFLSFEYWKDKDPVSVTVNWKGDTVGSEHDKVINASKRS
jgi:quercetin dioxygenase-like cupin family protein